MSTDAATGRQVRRSRPRARGPGSAGRRAEEGQPREGEEEGAQRSFAVVGLEPEEQERRERQRRGTRSQWPARSRRTMPAAASSTVSTIAAREAFAPSAAPARVSPVPVGRAPAAGSKSSSLKCAEMKS